MPMQTRRNVMERFRRGWPVPPERSVRQSADAVWDIAECDPTAAHTREIRIDRIRRHRHKKNRSMESKIL
jgi:hypothetical protein